jgi:UDP-glucose 4-epimerase
MDADFLLHLAWSSTPASNLPDDYEKKVNVIPSNRLIDCARGLRVKHFVFLSSAGAVYGPSNVPVSESNPLKPISPYGRAKAEVEMYLRKFYQPDFKVTILRPTNVIGAGQKFRLGQGILPAIVESVAKNHPFILQGNSIKDYIDILDLIKIVPLLKHQPNPFEIYNIGSGKLISTQEIIAKAQDIFGDRLRILNGKKFDTDVPYVAVNIQKATTELGWKVTRDPRRTIIKMLSQAKEKINL